MLKQQSKYHKQKVMNGREVREPRERAVAVSPSFTLILCNDSISNSDYLYLANNNLRKYLGMHIHTV